MEGTASRPITIVPDECIEADASLLAIVSHTSPICQPLQLIKDTSTVSAKAMCVKNKLREKLAANTNNASGDFINSTCVGGDTANATNVSEGVSGSDNCKKFGGGKTVSQDVNGTEDVSASNVVDEASESGRNVVGTEVESRNVAERSEVEPRIVEKDVSEESRSANLAKRGRGKRKSTVPQRKSPRLMMQEDKAEEITKKPKSADESKVPEDTDEDVGTTGNFDVAEDSESETDEPQVFHLDREGDELSKGKGKNGTDNTTENTKSKEQNQPRRISGDMGLATWNKTLVICPC